MPREVFGGLKDRDLVDALILQHEADRLGIPAGPEMGRELLKQITGGRMNGELFRALLQPVQQRGQRRAAPGRHRQPGSAGQRPAAARLADRHALRRLPGLSRPERAGRRQARRDSGREVPRQGSRALAKPTSRLYYDKYKDVLPDPGRETPGFKVPAPDPGRDPLDRRQRPGSAASGQADRERSSGRTTKTASRSSRFPRNCPRISSPASPS